MNKQITMDHIVSTLNRRDEVGRKAITMAIVRIYQRQTADEQRAGNTRHTNGIGFNAFDAKTGSYMARWALANYNRTGKVRLLTGKWLLKARKMALKYKKQLLAIAQDNVRVKQRAAEQRRLAEERARMAAAEQARLNAQHSAHIVSMLESEEEPPTLRHYRYNGPNTERSAVA
jgi:hypothetical protein